VFTKKDLDQLVAADADPAVSILMPTHVAGREVRQDPIRFDNLLKQAREKLLQRGWRGSDVDTMLAPAVALAQDGEFWRHQNKGLAVFVGPDTFHCHRVPLSLREEVVVTHRFQVTPLLPLLLDDERFFLVTVTSEVCKLYEASRDGMEEIEIPEMPGGRSEVMGESEYDIGRKVQSPARPQLQRQASPARGFGFPTKTPGDQGVGQTPEDTRKDMLVRFMQRAAAAVEDHLPGVTQAVVLAGPPEMVGHFRNASRLPSLHPEHIEVNPEAVGADDLHRRAWAFIDGRRRDTGSEAKEHFESLLNDGDDRASVKPEDVVKAARYGRVDTLLVARDMHLWGRYREDADRMEHHGTPRGEDEDLLNYAAIHTLRAGGAVHLLPKEEMPRGGVAAAIMRYGFDPDAPFEKAPG
jgi:hypothetical protein